MNSDHHILKNKGGRPKSPHPKVGVTIRLHPEVVAYFRSFGKGWHKRMAAILSEHVEAHTHPIMPELVDNVITEEKGKINEKVS